MRYISWYIPQLWPFKKDNYLVGGLEHEFYFSIYSIGNNNHPNWLIYFRGVKTTNELHNYGTSPSLISKSTINVPCSIAMLNYQRVWANNQNLRPTNANELVLCSLKQSYLSTKNRRLFTTSNHQSICEWVVVIHPTRGNLAMKIDRQYGFYHRMFDCNMLYMVLYIHI